MKSSKNKTAALILCAGKGTRAGFSFNKLFMLLGNGKTVVQTTVDKFRIPEVDKIVVAVAPGDMERMTALLPGVTLVEGGDSRTMSARRALDAAPDFDYVLIHDGARPFVSHKLIQRVLKTAQRYGSGIPSLPVTDTIKEASGGWVKATLVRESIFNVQTPQAFRRDRLEDAFNSVVGSFGDDSEVFERGGFDPRLVEGDENNYKLTTPGDFRRADLELIGHGFDVHPCEPGRRLVLGGVEIPFDKGLAGHSDADVVTHAVIDGILAACRRPDIGATFPDTDPAYAGISSMELLARVMKDVTADGYIIAGVTIVVIAEAPKMQPHIPAIRAKIAAAVGLDPDRVSVSATTTENLGVTADGKGMAASAFALVYRFAQ